MTRLKGTLMPLFCRFFLPPVLSKGKLKDTSTWPSFDILINWIFKIVSFDASPFVADCSRWSFFAASTFFF